MKQNQSNSHAIIWSASNPLLHEKKNLLNHNNNGYRKKIYSGLSAGIFYTA